MIKKNLHFFKLMIYNLMQYKLLTFCIEKEFKLKLIILIPLGNLHQHSLYFLIHNHLKDLFNLNKNYLIYIKVKLKAFMVHFKRNFSLINLIKLKFSFFTKFIEIYQNQFKIFINYILILLNEIKKQKIILPKLLFISFPVNKLLNKLFLIKFSKHKLQIVQFILFF